ncbi:hypothetical protein ACFS2C_06705 [Prauserella oleivorans]|uniref:Uncharacterized protein n=1 Tax=Prauserella oleivorans TaxID=1478153 RepID=A0ABW5W566_9PSEU
MNPEESAVRRAVLELLADGAWRHRGEALAAGYLAAWTLSDTVVGKVIARMTREGVIEARGHWSRTHDDREVRLSP